MASVPLTHEQRRRLRERLLRSLAIAELPPYKRTPPEKLTGPWARASDDLIDGLEAGVALLARVEELEAALRAIRLEVDWDSEWDRGGWAPSFVTSAIENVWTLANTALAVVGVEEAGEQT